MEDYKEVLITNLINGLHNEFGISYNKLRNLLDKAMSEYSITKNETALVVSDLHEKIEYFLASKRVDGISDETIKNYALQLSQFQRFIIKPTNSIDVNDIRLYIAFIQHEKNLKPSSVGSMITIIKGFFSFLHNEGFIDKNPTSRIKATKFDKKSLRKSLDVEELEKLREACKDPREKAIIEFAYSTACRASEIISVKISDIKENTLRVIGKGDVERTVYISAKCRIYINNYLVTRNVNSEYLFIGSKAPHKKLTVSGLEKIFKRIAARTDISKSIYPHILRHTWAVNALRSGMNINIIQEILGHKHPQTTQIYAKLDTSSIQYEYNRFMAC
jgi:integrase/recombinase XerD